MEYDLDLITNYINTLDSTGNVKLDLLKMNEFDNRLIKYLLTNPILFFNQIESQLEGDRQVEIDGEIPHIQIDELRSKYLNRLIKIDGKIVRHERNIKLSREVLSANDKFYEKYFEDQINFSNLPIALSSAAYIIQNNRKVYLRKEDGQSNYLNRDMYIVQGSDNKTNMRGLKVIFNSKKNTETFNVGEEIEIVGVYRPLYFNKIEGMFIALTISRKKEEQKISRKPDFTQLDNLIAPTIYGHSHIKKALLIQLILIETEKRRRRESLNILLVGDPGTGKSQMLRGAAKLSDRKVFLTGRSTTVPGLLSAIVNNKLELGGVVRADGGLLIFDEIEKSSTAVLSALNEPMENRTVSLNKGNFNGELNARCSFLCAANSLKNLSSSLLSRFDLIFHIKDTRDFDEEIADHIFKEEVQYDYKLIKEFIADRKDIRPTLSKEAANRIVDQYRRREEGMMVRSMEAIIRLSFGIAKLYKETVVTVEHVEEAIQLINNNIGIERSSNENLTIPTAPVSEDRLDQLKEILLGFKENRSHVNIAEVAVHLEDMSRDEIRSLLAELERQELLMVSDDVILFFD